MVKNKDTNLKDRCADGSQTATLSDRPEGCENMENKKVEQDAALQEEGINEQEQSETNVTEVDTLHAKVAELEARVAELEDLKLRQMAEFDNFRRRTNKEKLELMTTAGERIFCDMLPLVDDFERALSAMSRMSDNGNRVSDNGEAVKEGVELIYNKFIGFLAANNVKAIDTTDADFNTDLHEAITTFAAGEDKKGKVIDCTQTGYTLGEKVIRFAKVVVGE
jgi:molecular chaperone GrpE